MTGALAEPLLVQAGQPVQGVPLGHALGAWHGWRDVRLLVLGEDVDAALVARRLRPRGGQERVDEGQCLVDGVHPAADADQLGVVVLAGQRRRLDAPRQGAARAGHLVGGDLLAVAGAADDDAEAVRVGDGPLRRRDAERRVVVLGVVGEGAAVDRLVAARLAGAR